MLTYNYRVMFRDDDDPETGAPGEYVLASRIFATKDDAEKYARSIAATRFPIVVRGDVLISWREVSPMCWFKGKTLSTGAAFRSFQIIKRRYPWEVWGYNGTHPRGFPWELRVTGGGVPPLLYHLTSLGDAYGKAAQLATDGA